MGLFGRTKPADELKAANLDNIRKKLARGRTLTRPEQQALDSAQKEGGPPVRARKLQLCVLLSLSRQTLDTYLTLPGAPMPDDARTYDVEAVATWIAANAKTIAADQTAANYRQEKTRLEAEGLAFDLQVKRGEYFAKKDAAPSIHALTTELVANMRQKFEMELPARYVGKGMIECQMLNAEAVDWVLKRFKAGNKPFVS